MKTKTGFAQFAAYFWGRFLRGIPGRRLEIVQLVENDGPGIKQMALDWI
jgi:hypothetical protein